MLSLKPQHQFALEREMRQLRTSVNDTASRLSEVASTWNPDNSVGPKDMGTIESLLATLNARVAEMRALQDAVTANTWTPKPEHL